MRKVQAYLHRYLIRLPLGEFHQRLIRLYQIINGRQRDPRITVGLGHILVDLGDDDVGAGNGRRQDIDTDAQRNILIFARRSDLNDRAMDRHLAR